MARSSNGAASTPDLSGLAEPTAYQDESKPVSEDIVNWVESAYKYWIDNPTRWRTVVLESEQAVAHAVSEGRRYVTKVRETPLTLQVKQAGTSGNKLTYRVRETLQRGSRSNG